MAEWALDPAVFPVTMTPIVMAVSLDSKLAGAHLCSNLRVIQDRVIGKTWRLEDQSETQATSSPAEQRFQAALVDVSCLQGEVDRTYQALEQIERERTDQDHEYGRFQARLADIRFQLSELSAIGAERRALRQAATVLVAQIDALQEQHLKMQQRMAAMRRQWFAGKATDRAADTEEQLLELRLGWQR